MTHPENSRHLPPEYYAAADSASPLVSLTNLAAVRDRMDSLQRFLVDSVNSNTILPNHQMERVSSELTSAIHQVIVNGAALLAFSQPQSQPHPIQSAIPDPGPIDSKPEISDPQQAAAEEAAESDKEDEKMEGETEDLEIVEVDAVELLAEHIHFCEICGKGFKRDANLRMHMRAHGNRFKTLEALSKPDNKSAAESTAFGGGGGGGRRTTRFSCPYMGCNRNQQHKSFRPLKSIICVKNHFKRSHCPKLFSCNRCHKKSFSVVADLKSHLKHCGDTRWRCSSGTTFSRKDKLFGHMALFEGHMPAVGPADDDDKSRTSPGKAAAMTESVAASAVAGGGSEVSFEGLMEGFGSIENQCLEETMIGGGGSDWNLNMMMDEYFNF